MITGIGLIGIVSASVASWFVARGRKKNEAETEEAIEETEQDVEKLTTEIAALRAEQADMKALLEQLVQSRNSGA